MSSPLMKFFLPPVIGAFLATLAMLGLVYSQTNAPDTNPASEPVLTYGD